MTGAGSGHDRPTGSSGGVAVRHPELHIGAVDGHPGQRRLRVTAEVFVSDELAGATLTETITVRAARIEDPPVAPTTEPIVVSREVFQAIVGSTERRSDLIVNRSSLDVEQDWWSSGQGGETQPIAEWIDYIVADVQIAAGDEVLAEATTPIVEGSWGAVGHGQTDHPID